MGKKKGGDIMHKNFLIGFFILATFLLEGCSSVIAEETKQWRPYGAEGEHSDAYWERYDEVNTKGVKLAKQYVKDKYGDDLKVSYAEPETALGGFGEGEGFILDRVTVSDRKGYSVFVNVTSKEIRDNRQSKLIREDLLNNYIVEEGLIEEIAVTGSGSYYEQYYDGDLIDFFEKEGGLTLENSSIDIVANRTLNSKDEILDYLLQIISKFRSLEDSFNINRLDVYISLVKPGKHEKGEHCYGSLHITKRGNTDFHFEPKIY